MNVTLSIEDDVMGRARRCAEALGKSVNQLVREYLEGLTEPQKLEALADEFKRMSQDSKGNSRGWKFNRDELHERK